MWRRGSTNPFCPPPTDSPHKLEGLVGRDAKNRRRPFTPHRRAMLTASERMLRKGSLRMEGTWPATTG